MTNYYLVNSLGMQYMLNSKTYHLVTIQQTQKIFPNLFRVKTQKFYIRTSL